MKKKLSLFVLGILCISLVIMGCQKSENSEEQIEEKLENKVPVVGGELVLPVIRFHTLNPVVNDNQNVYYLNQIVYEGLLKLDSNFKVQPALATKWNIVEDGSEIQFELRKEVTWHDGNPFTAEDVKFTIDALKLSSNNKNKTIYSTFVQNIKEVRILSPQIVSIKLDSPTTTFIEAFTFPIIPKHQFKNIQEVYSKINTPPVGTGPYKVNAYDKYSSIKLIPYEDYWKKGTYISQITAKIVPDNEAALTSVEANEIDVAQAQNYDWEKFASDKSIRIYEYISQEYEFLSFNLNNEILKDNNIRKAIAFGIDRHKITDEVYLGHSTVTDVPIHPDSYLYNEEVQEIGYDVEKAQELLTTSNWINRDMDDVLENEEGLELRIRLLVNENNPERLRTAEIITNQLKLLGIDVLIQSFNWGEYEKRLAEKNYDISLAGWQFGAIPDLRFAFHSNFVTSTNLSGYSDPEMDLLLDEVAGIISSEVKIQKYNRIQKKIVEEIPYLSLFFKNSSLIIKNEIKGNISPNYYNIYNNMTDWYILEE